MIQDVVIIGGGSPDSWPDIAMFNKETTAFIGVDRGTLYALKLGFFVEQAVGDFDSLTETEFEWISGQVSDVKRCPAEKDDTDMQLGVLAAINKYPDANYYLIGATGGRLDHYLSNLWIPLQERFMPFIGKISIIDNQNTITYYLPGEYVLAKESDKKYLAYVCLTAVEKLTLFDAKYTLAQTDFKYPISLSSNEFIGETSRFSFETGVVCVIQSKDL